MCGRYSQTGTIEKIASVFAVNEWVDFEPRYNIAPSKLAPVIVNVDETRVLDLYRWGLIPSWAKEMKIGYKMINAHCETVGEKPSYRRLVNQRRCIVPTDGFFEWEKSEDGKTKTPIRIMMQTEMPFAFATFGMNGKLPKDNPCGHIRF